MGSTGLMSMLLMSEMGLWLEYFSDQFLLLFWIPWVRWKGLTSVPFVSETNLLLTC